MKINRSLLLAELAELFQTYNVTITGIKFADDNDDKTFSAFISGIKEDNIND